MFPDSPAMREQDRLTAEAFADPRPGDRFHEMFSAWVVVVSAGADGVKVMCGSGPVNLRHGRFPDGERVAPFPERAVVRWYATAADFRDANRYGSIDGYTVMLAGRGLDVSGWLERAQSVPVAPTHPAPGPKADADLLGDALDRIGDRIRNGSRLQVAERDAPHLLAALRLVLRLYGRYVATEDYAVILAALTGKEAPTVTPWPMEADPQPEVEWGVRFTIGSRCEQPCPDEADARAVVSHMQEERPEWDAEVIWRTAERPAGPWNEEERDAERS